MKNKTYIQALCFFLFLFYAVLSSFGIAFSDSIPANPYPTIIYIQPNIVLSIASAIPLNPIVVNEKTSVFNDNSSKSPKKVKGMGDLPIVKVGLGD